MPARACVRGLKTKEKRNSATVAIWVVLTTVSLRPVCLLDNVSKHLKRKWQLLRMVKEVY